MERQRRLNSEYRRRLRERFIRHGLDGFHSHEVVELLLTHASTSGDVRLVARRLIERFGGLRGIMDAAASELRTVEGIGEKAAVLIKLFKEVGTAYLRERMTGKDVIRSKKDVLDYLTMALSGERVEKFLAIYLNSRNEVLAVDTLHEGTINQTVVYPRKVIERAFRHNAHAVIFVHNHPSGDPLPSGVDWQLTGVLERAARAVDLIVHDHIIIGRQRHFSARDSGWFDSNTRIVGMAAMPRRDFARGAEKKPGE